MMKPNSLGSLSWVMAWAGGLAGFIRSIDYKQVLVVERWWVIFGFGMLKQGLAGKTVAIVGHQTLTAKIILKKIITLPDTRILLLLLKPTPQASHKYSNDPYFSPTEQQAIQTRVAFVSLDSLPAELQGGIDVLFCAASFVDFSSPTKIVESHLLATSRIVGALSKTEVRKVVLLSSVYVRGPGYLPEEDELDEPVIPAAFDNTQAALTYLQDNFQDPIEAWRFTMNYVEQSYFRIGRQLTVLRVPSLGPTITDYEGHLSQPSPFSYFICQTGLGLIHHLQGVGSNKIDVVPTDYASNLMLVLAVRPQSNRIETLNLSTTTRNFITLSQLLDICVEAWREYGEKVRPIRIVESEWGRRLQSEAERLPSQVKRRVGTLLGVVSWKIEGQKQELELQQKRTAVERYRYFFSNEWECESIKAIDLFRQMSPEDQASLNFNLNQLNWKLYGKLCVYAVRKHIMGHEVEPFKPESLDMLAQSQSYFSDIMWAMRLGKNSEGQASREAVQFVLHSKVVKEAIRAAVEENMLKLENPATSYEKVEEEMTRVAEEMCVSMFSSYSMGSIRLFAWFLHKLFSSMYERVVTNKSDMARIQAHDETRGPLVIVPTHRSYIDFLIISYVFFGHGIKCPHIAAAEDFLNMAVVHVLLRRSGAFFIKRSQQKYKDIYRAVLNEYLAKLMLGNHYLQFFIEGTRSRTGKMLSPKLGVLSVLMRHVQEARVRDAFIMPVTINYEKVLEGNSFTYEMMGETKVKESLSRVIKAVDVLKENYGRIYLEFSAPISLKHWLAHAEGPFQQKVSALGVRIVSDLTRNLVISGPAVVSSVLLMNQKGVSDDSLQEQSVWLSREIASRGVKLSRSQADSSVSMGSTLALLEGVISKSKKDMFEMEVSFDQNSFVKLFTLTYHRNTLAHIFFQEATVVTALTSFGHALASEGVPSNSLRERTLELDHLLQREFYSTQLPLTSPERYAQVITLLESRGVLTVEGEKVAGRALESNFFQLYHSLVWPVVESYWIACLYLFKLTSSALALPKLLQQIQWFGQSLLNDRIAAFPEAISSDTIKNAISLFTSLGLLLSEKGQVKVKAGESGLRETLHGLQIFLKRTYGKSMQGRLQSRQGSLTLDFPFLSKL